MTVPFIVKGRYCTSTSGNAWADLGAGKRTSVTRTLEETAKRCVVIRAIQLNVGDMRANTSRLLKCNKFSDFWRAGTALAAWCIASFSCLQ